MLDLVREYKAYVLATAFALVLAVVIALSRGIFFVEEMEMLITILSDAVLIPGILLLGLGLIIFASNQGVFLGITYGFKMIGRTITTKKDEKLVDEEYHEYYARQKEKKVECKCFLIVGGIFVALSVLLVIVYFCVA